MRRAQRPGRWRGPPEQDAPHPDGPGPLDVVPVAVAHHHRLARLGTEQVECRPEDAGVRLVVAVLGRRDPARDETVELEVAGERLEGAVGVGDQAQPKPPPPELAEGGHHVVVELEVVARGPLAVHLLGATLEVRPGAPHLLDEVADVAKEEGRVVDQVVGIVEQRRGARHRGVVGGRVAVGDAVTGAEVAVPVGLEERPRVDEGEIDVEEHGSGNGHRGPIVLQQRPAGSRRGAAGLEWA